MDDELMTGANELEAAEPTLEEQVNTVEDGELDSVEGAKEQEAAEPVEQEKDDSDINAKYAAARRKAEEESNKRIQSINAQFKEKFGHLINPAKGRPIETYADYLEAIEYQARVAQEKELREKGVDPALIEQMVNNSPAVKQAQMVLEQQRNSEASRRLESDLKVVSSIDPDIKTIEDIEKHESFPTVLEYVKKGLSLPDAYKVANFEKLAERKSQAAKQAAINQAKSKGHMERTNGVSVDSSTFVPIPDNVLSRWKDSYPDLTMEQLTAKYNATI